jgi:hypothetical protein
VVDRIVEGHAVLLVGDQEDEHHVPASQLPEGSGEGSRLWLGANVAGGIEILDVDREGEQEQHTGLTERLEHLRHARPAKRFRP